MSVVEALLSVLAAAVGLTLVSGVGWFVARRWPAAAEHYVTVARLEAVLAQQQQRHDAALAAMDRRLEQAVARQDQAVARQDALEDELDEERELRRMDHARVADLQRLVEVWMSYARQLAEIIRRELKTEPPPEPVVIAAPPAPRTGSRARMVELSRKIAELFSQEEINDLAFQLDLLGVLRGETLEERASSLVMVALRRHAVEQLVALCRAARPNGGF